MSSSDSDVPDAAWARHYAEAASRRRARGWHRRDAGSRRRALSRPKLYVAVGGLFLAVTILALLLPR